MRKTIALIDVNDILEENLATAVDDELDEGDDEDEGEDEEDDDTECRRCSGKE
jgi:hypothetical protein